MSLSQPPQDSVVYYKPYQPQETVEEEEEEEEEVEVKEPPASPSPPYYYKSESKPQESPPAKEASYTVYRPESSSYSSSDSDGNQIEASPATYEFGFTEGSFKIPDFFRNFLSAPPPWINIGGKGNRDWRRRRR